MPQLSPRSKERLYTCDEALVRVVERAIILVPKEYDFTVLCGHRGEAEQNAAFHEKRSKLRWPKSKHNSTPSLAVDIAPYPINWNDLQRFYAVATYMFKAAQIEKVEIRWGGQWTSFRDYPHWELVDNG